MKTIWKFPLVITDQQEIMMPKDAEIISAHSRATSSACGLRSIRRPNTSPGDS